MRTWNFERELQRYGPNSTDPPMALAEARAYCEYVAKSHYENFTVASWFLPKRLRPHFHAVYAYCRWADDLADETGGCEESLRLLKWWRGELLAGRASDGNYLPQLNDTTSKGNLLPSLARPANNHPVMIALAETIQQFHIPREPFLNLLIAFEQDQTVKQYDNFDQLLGYCSNSANPVGRIVLHLFECYDEERAKLSDEICTGLQLANFWQDVARDNAIGRIYLPGEDCNRFGVKLKDFRSPASTSEVDLPTPEGLPKSKPDFGSPSPEFRELLKFQVDRTRGYFERGRRLLPLVPREFRIDLDLFCRGGEAILRAIEKQKYDVLTTRPRLGRWAKFKLLLRASRTLLPIC